MKQKNTGKIIALMILISLAMPMVLANDIQNFLVDMKAHPGNYYVYHNMTSTWANRTDLGMLNSINNFISYFGVVTSSVEIPGKNAVIFSFPGDSFAINKNYSTFLSPNSFVETVKNSTEHGGINYTQIYINYDSGDYYNDFVSKCNLGR